MIKEKQKLDKKNTTHYNNNNLTKQKEVIIMKSMKEINKLSIMAIIIIR